MRRICHQMYYLYNAQAQRVVLVRLEGVSTSGESAQT